MVKTCGDPGTVLGGSLWSKHVAILVHGIIGINGNATTYILPAEVPTSKKLCERFIEMDVTRPACERASFWGFRFPMTDFSPLFLQP